MQSNCILTDEQTLDLQKRLISFRDTKIQPALQAFKSYGSIITSAERLANQSLCFNFVDLKREAVDAVCKLLTTHATHGFYNMALERHNYLHCSDINALRTAAAERIYCSFIFIIHPNAIDAPAKIIRKVPLSAGITENMYDKSIDTQHIKAMLIPEGLLAIAKSIFPEVKQYIAPLTRGNLGLSIFTRSTALESKNGESRIPNITIPDYTTALKMFIAANPEMSQFITHLSRFSTRDDLKKPFTKPSSNEAKIFESASQKRLMQLMFSSADSQEICDFVAEKNPNFTAPAAGLFAKSSPIDSKQIQPLKKSPDSNEELNETLVYLSLFKKTTTYKTLKSDWKHYYDRLYSDVMKEFLDRVSSGEVKLLMTK